MVSVIVAAYNAEPWIRDCLDSILSQTLHDLEVICVDDGSEDNTLAALHVYEEKDNRVHVIHQEHRSAGAARNTGLSLAKGKYLSFLDADDFFELNMLEKCVTILDREASDIVVFPAMMFHEGSGKNEFLPWSCKKEYLPSKRPFAPTEMQQYLFNAFQNWAWNKVFRHEFIKQQRILFQDVPRTNDMAFVCEALASAKLISVLENPFAHYRTGNVNSLQSSNHLSPLAFWDAFIETKIRLERRGLYHYYEQSYLNWVLEGALQNARSNRDTFARAYIACLLHFECEHEFGILTHSRDYYYDPGQYDEYRIIIESDTLPATEALSPNIRFQEELESIKLSKAYKLSLALSYIPRKLRTIMRKN